MRGILYFGNSYLGVKDETLEIIFLVPLTFMCISVFDLAFLHSGLSNEHYHSFFLLLITKPNCFEKTKIVYF